VDIQLLNVDILLVVFGFLGYKLTVPEIGNPEPDCGTKNHRPHNTQQLITNNKTGAHSGRL
jgi:hypothetical protein